ncbi:IS3 family transposase [Tepidibacillus marianensis]|uniref:IS3 family transposase n=1 Tax=Tepidibacillus marianensis TaxID=3131995 RepID=UPI00386ABEC3
MKKISIDQGSHFTNADYLNLLVDHHIQVSMNGKRRAIDNSSTERFFKSLKYECIYLNEFENTRELCKGIAKYVEFYNTEPHINLWIM